MAGDLNCSSKGSSHSLVATLWDDCGFEKEGKVVVDVACGSVGTVEEEK